MINLKYFFGSESEAMKEGKSHHGAVDNFSSEQRICDSMFITFVMEISFYCYWFLRLTNQIQVDTAKRSENRNKRTRNNRIYNRSRD